MGSLHKELNISTQIAQKLKATVLNQFGVILVEKTIFKNGILDLSMLDAGVFILELQHEGKIWQTKIVKL